MNGAGVMSPMSFPLRQFFQFSFSLPTLSSLMREEKALSFFSRKPQQEWCWCYVSPEPSFLHTYCFQRTMIMNISRVVRMRMIAKREWSSQTELDIWRIMYILLPMDNDHEHQPSGEDSIIRMIVKQIESNRTGYLKDRVLRGILMLQVYITPAFYP